jgi:hypothetical protein
MCTSCYSVAGTTAGGGIMSPRNRQPSEEEVIIQRLHPIQVVDSPKRQQAKKQSNQKDVFFHNTKIKLFDIYEIFFPFFNTDSIYII